MTLLDFNETFADELRDPEFAAAYLEEAIEQDIDTFLVALRDVMRVRGGMTALAKKTSLQRTSLYKTVRRHGNPELRTTQTILEAMGMRLFAKRAQRPPNGKRNPRPMVTPVTPGESETHAVGGNKPPASRGGVSGGDRRRRGQCIPCHRESQRADTFH